MGGAGSNDPNDGGGGGGDGGGGSDPPVPGGTPPCLSVTVRTRSDGCVVVNACGQKTTVCG